MLGPSFGHRLFFFFLIQKNTLNPDSDFNFHHGRVEEEAIQWKLLTYLLHFNRKLQVGHLVVICQVGCQTALQYTKRWQFIVAMNRRISFNPVLWFRNAYKHGLKKNHGIHIFDICLDLRLIADPYHAQLWSDVTQQTLWNHTLQTNIESSQLSVRSDHESSVFSSCWLNRRSSVIWVWCTIG